VRAARWKGAVLSELLRAISNYLSRVSTYDPVEVIVEMALIALVVGWAVGFVRGTRGASLVKGAAVVIGLVYLCIRLLPKDPDRDWERIQWLYGRFILFALAALLVAFQPELRRALSQLGRGRLFGAPSPYAEEQIEELVEAARILSRDKTGAIMAIERKVGLGGLMESGALLDAELSVPLLTTIFMEGTALHDMGVIVQSGRIAAAGCQFPLAESEEVDASLGTRHRAALGLSKETDAIVLVVSEETGRITIANQGQLNVGLDVDALRELLRNALAPKPRGFLARLLHRRPAGDTETN